MPATLPTAQNPVLILNDCALAALRTLPDACVDAIVTSPPYWGLRDYGIEPTDWPPCSYAPMPGLPAIEVPAERSCLGLETTLHAFLAHLVLIFEECRRVLKPTGSAWVNMGDGYAGGGGGNYGNLIAPDHGQHPTNVKNKPGWLAEQCLKPKDLIGQPWRVAFALQAAGWYLRQDNIWHKPNPMPESIRDRATKAHEYVFHLTKSERYYFDLDAWAEKAGSAASYKQPDGWDTGKGGHGTFHRNGREKGKPASKRNSFAREHKTTGAHFGQKMQFRPDREVVDYSLTRNKRSVWTVPTVAYAEAHYATYPPRLITPPLLASTSAKGCCSACGKPWERQAILPSSKDAPKRQTSKGEGVPDPRGYKTSAGQAWQDWRAANPTTFTAWQPTCRCSESPSLPLSVSPSLVLDPFGGSGTTAQVALEHGRHAILIERGPHNVALIRKRLAPFLAAPVLNLA